MIPLRSPAFAAAPPPPAWLDPNLLGARALRATGINPSEVLPGAPGIIAYLHGLRIGTVPPQETIVVASESSPENFYIYSREMFLLAAYLLADACAVADPFNFHHGLRLTTRGRPEVLLQVLREGLSRRQAFKTTLVHPQLPGLVRLFFDLHEYAIADLVVDAASIVPNRAAVAKTPVGQSLRVWSPNTSSLLELASAHGDADSAPTHESKARIRNVEVRALKKRAAVGTEIPVGSTKTPKPLTEVRRTPHLVIGEQVIKPAQRFTVQVYADRQAADPGSATTDLRVQAPANMTEIFLTAWIMPSRHFSVIGDERATLRLEFTQERSNNISFTLVANQPGEPDDPRLLVVFSFKGRPCGSVARAVPLEGRPVPIPPSDQRDVIAPRLDVSGADIEVVVAAQSAASKSFNVTVTCPRLPGWTEGKREVWELNAAAKDFVDGHFASFVDSDSQSPTARRANLRGVGMDLFAAAPQIFRDAFWALREAQIKTSSINIVTEEPFIPWELMVPNRGKESDDYPLGITHAVGRALGPGYEAAPRKVPLTRSLIFAPDYPPGTPPPLVHAKDEAQFVLAHIPGQSITPATFDGIETAVGNDPASLLHFVCHGESAGAAAHYVICEDLLPLRSAQIKGSRAIEKFCAQNRPLVFLNACKVGRTAPSLTGSGGFAATFMQLGAAGVIAPLWSVDDAKAFEVAKEFYTLQQRSPARAFADILREIRRRAIDGNADDTFAAYCFYGDPLAAAR